MSINGPDWLWVTTEEDSENLRLFEHGYDDPGYKLTYLRKDGLPKEAIEALRELHAEVLAIGKILSKRGQGATLLGMKDMKAQKVLARWDKLEEGE